MTYVQRVLVIEPDASVASDLRFALAPASLEVVVVADGTHAIQWVDDHGTPDAAVIDVALPDLDAATLIALLRRRSTDALPRFFVSRDARVGPRFDDAPVLAVPFEAIEARAVLSEALIESQARLDR